MVFQNLCPMKHLLSYLRAGESNTYRISDFTGTLTVSMDRIATLNLKYKILYSQRPESLPVAAAGRNKNTNGLETQ